MDKLTLYQDAILELVDNNDPTAQYHLDMWLAAYGSLLAPDNPPALRHLTTTLHSMYQEYKPAADFLRLHRS